MATLQLRVLARKLTIEVVHRRRRRQVGPEAEVEVEAVFGGRWAGRPGGEEGQLETGQGHPDCLD